MQQEPTNYHENLFKGASNSTFENARNNRKVATKAEEVMWQALRGKKVNGLKFRRQHPISTFIADFYCAEKKVIIELDGEIHETQKEYDENRDSILQEMGIKVTRFKNGEVNIAIEFMNNL